MMQAIHIGILGKNPGWEKILDQIGVSWSIIDTVSSLNPTQYSCIIIEQSLDRDDKGLLSEYLDAKGALIDTHGQLLKQKPDRRRVGTIFPDSINPAFRHIEKIEVNGHCLIHPISDLLEGSIWFDPAPKRSYAFVGLPLKQLAGIQPLTHTQFKSSDLPAVAERTSARSSNPYFEVILAVLRKLHSKSDIPLVHKWWMPDSDKLTATFRIDTDYGTKDTINSAAASALENHIPVTWFLHVEAHESWLNHFHRYTDHEIALHCFRHSEYKSRQQYTEDISRALRIVKVHGFNPSGYAAPYGVWSRELSDALAGQTFHYSSEFGYDYDSLPSVPSASCTLQIPIHPLSVGSFSRFRFSSEMIARYFNEIIQLKRLQHQPLLLYHHPNDGHEDLLRTIFRSENHEITNWITYTHWASWWHKRSSSSFQPFYDAESKTVHLANTADIPVAIHNGTNHFFVTHERKITLEESRFSAYIDPDLVKLIHRRRNGNKLSAIKLRKDQLMTRLWRNRV